MGINHGDHGAHEYAESRRSKGLTHSSPSPSGDVYAAFRLELTHTASMAFLIKPSESPCAPRPLGLTSVARRDHFEHRRRFEFAHRPAAVRPDHVPMRWSVVAALDINPAVESV